MSQKLPAKDRLSLIKMHEKWAEDHPCWIDGVIENLDAAKIHRFVMEEEGTIQDECVYGYVLPDRCRYNSITGCDCGAYPPTSKKWDKPADRYEEDPELCWHTNVPVDNFK
jgi:hypothetical protein